MSEEELGMLKGKEEKSRGEGEKEMEIIRREGGKEN